MTFLHLTTLSVSLAVLSANGSAQQVNSSADTPSAEVIMARVAANQDKTEAERGHYVYIQHARVVSRKGSIVMCEEVTDYRVTPSASDSHRELIRLDGRMLIKHKYVAYTSLLPSDGKTDVENDHNVSLSMGNEDTDRTLVESMRTSLTDDKSKDGINAQLFPLTTKGQGNTLFHLAGRERINGRDVFHIDFRPKDKNGFGWKGDAYVDVDAYQPVLIRTDMARKIPVAVRALLGTNVPGLASASSMRRSRMACGFQFRSGPSSRFTCCSSSADRSLLTLRIVTSRRPTSTRRLLELWRTSGQISPDLEVG